MNVINLPQYGVLSYSFKDVLSSLKEPLGPLGTALNSLHCLSIRQRFGKLNTSTGIFCDFNLQPINAFEACFTLQYRQNCFRFIILENLFMLLDDILARY